MTKDAIETTSDTVASTTSSTEPPTTVGTSSATASNNNITPLTISSTDAQGSSLCSSCDNCRTRKTKCDGRRPCSSCTAKYLKKLKVDRYEVVVWLWKLLEHWTALKE